MDFFDTLRNPHTKALFKVLAMDRYGRDGASFIQIRQSMTHTERFALFLLVHRSLKAVGLKPDDEPEPELLVREHPQYATSDYYAQTDSNYPYEGPR